MDGKRLWSLVLVVAAGVGPLLATQGLRAQDEGDKKKRASLNVEVRKRESKTKGGGPQLNRSAVFAVQVEKALIANINKTLAYLEKTAAGLPKKSNQRLQLLERILNLNLEQATYVRAEEERDYDKKWRAWNDGGRKGGEPKLNNKESNKHWLSVIKWATDTLEEYPQSKNADVVTFNKAVGLQYIGKEKEAARIYTQLIQRYPNSPIAGDAYASLGDFYFDRNDFRNAMNNYKAAMRYKKSKRYLWSIFKLGWCNYNLGRYQDSLKFWKLAVSQSKAVGESGSQVKEEALRDMVYSWAESKDIEGAIAYYRANEGTKYIGPFLLLLASILTDQGQYGQAISTLKKFQKEAPTASEGPDAQKEIVSLAYNLGKLSAVWKELEKFEDLYGTNSSWAKANDRKLVVETQAMIKDQIYYYSTLTLDRAIKDDNRQLNLEAKKGFLLFLKRYPKAKEIAEVKYYLADIEYYLKDYREAGGYYAEIASLGKKNAVRYDPKSGKAINIHREAAVDMVRSFVKDFEPEFKALKKRVPDFKKPKPLSVSARNYIRACGKYTAWYPEDKVRKKTCETDITKIYYNSGDKKNSIQFLKLLAKNYSKEKEGPASVELLIPLYKDDRDGLLKTTEELLKIPEYRKGEIGRKLTSLQRGAEKESIAQEKDILKRAKRYEAQAKKYPNDPEVDKLWYNAAVDYVKAGELASAISAYGVIVNRFPKSEQAEESLLQIAKIYEKEIQFGEASKHYLEFNKRYPKAKEAVPALAKSCELLIAIESENQLATCQVFIQRYQDVAQAYVERMITAAERRKRYALMSDLIKKYYLPVYKLSQNDQIVAWNSIQKASGGGAGAQEAQQKMIAIFAANPDGVSGEALRYIGELAFRRAIPAIKAYEAVKLVGGTVDRLAASLEKKAGAFVQLEKAMGDVVGTKDSWWGVAALYSVGHAHEQYADALENPPAIQGASKEDVVKQLAPQIKERRAAALNVYKTAQDTVNKFKVYNEWSLKALTGLSRTSGKKLTLQDFVVQPDMLGTEVPQSIANALRERD